MKRLLFALGIALSMSAQAALPTTTSVAGPYSCNGTQVDYSVPFKFLDNSHLVVTRETGGLTTTLAIGTDYTVTGAGGSSGTVTLVAGSRCPSGTELTITRTVPLTQPLSLPTQGAFSPKSIETALDRTEMQVQQLQDLYGPLAAAAVGPQGPAGSISAIGSDVDFGNTYKPINVPDPTSPQDLATKAYVDTLVDATDFTSGTLSYISPWGDIGGGSVSTCQKSGNGLVVLNVAAVRASTSGDSSILTVPVGYRPAGYVATGGVTLPGASSVACYLGSDGVVRMAGTLPLATGYTVCTIAYVAAP